MNKKPAIKYNRLVYQPFLIKGGRGAWLAETSYSLEDIQDGKHTLAIQKAIRDRFPGSVIDLMTHSVFPYTRKGIQEGKVTFSELDDVDENDAIITGVLQPLPKNTEELI